MWLLAAAAAAAHTDDIAANAWACVFATFVIIISLNQVWLLLVCVSPGVRVFLCVPSLMCMCAFP